PIFLPPLRERIDDIALLATHFINRFAKKTGKKINALSNKALHDLQHYQWPGNIRELEHLIERSVLMTTGTIVKKIDLPTDNIMIASITAHDHHIKTIEENERDHIIKALKHCKGRISGPCGAAKMLGVPPTTLSSKLKKLGIRRGFTV
ncbi:MAG: helix-turn-helix domain-containing protein, partial [Mucilaginibacter sp.]|uniref:sigma-54-dependent Fis family transcriptional regulator n=1 Tax=Mucilaginibacter sp. TaxID=1882438 RepID=UPI0031A50411